MNYTGDWNGPFAYGGAFGYQSDDDSGLMLLGHRYYDSSTGRFLSRDPIGDGSNWYVYCKNNPISFADVDGLDEHCIVTGPIRNLPNLSKDAKDVFGKSTIPAGKHNYAKPHPNYNKAVKELWDNWISGKDPSKLTGKQAQEFVEQILKSKDPRITAMWTKVAALAGEKSSSIVAKKALGKLGVVITVFFFIDDAKASGIGHAINELLWPISCIWTADYYDFSNHKPGPPCPRVGYTQETIYTRLMY